MRKECSLYYLAFACFGMFGASQSKQASKTQQQWNIEALSKGATHIGEDRVGHSLDTSLLPCRLQQRNVQCSTKGPRYAKNLSYQTDSHGLAHSAGKTRNHNFILHMQYVLHCYIVLLLLIDSNWNFVLSYGLGFDKKPKARAPRQILVFGASGACVMWPSIFDDLCKMAWS